MRKRHEVEDLASCLNRARPEEWVFVLLGRDAAAPATIRFWCEERVKRGKNTYGDAQIREAMEVARLMEDEGRQAPVQKQHVADGSCCKAPTPTVERESLP